MPGGAEGAWVWRVSSELTNCTSTLTSASVESRALVAMPESLPAEVIHTYPYCCWLFLFSLHNSFDFNFFFNCAIIYLTVHYFTHL